MGNSVKVIALKALFIGMGCLMVATLLYTLLTDGSPFRKDVLFPWLTTTLIDFYINVFVLAAWVSYKESSWLGAVLWVILLVCLGSATTCLYITIQLFRLSAEESTQDLMYHLLLRDQNKSGVVKRSSSQLVTARVIFGVLGCLIFGIVLYTVLKYGLPFNKELLTPWMAATLIDFYINITAISVWIGYKESSWFVTFGWIILLICFGRWLSRIRSRVKRKQPLCSHRGKAEYNRPPLPRLCGSLFGGTGVMLMMMLVFYVVRSCYEIELVIHITNTHKEAQDLITGHMA